MRHDWKDPQVTEPAPNISAFGEKRLIAEFIRPLFNGENAVGGVGDDCAMLDLGGGQLLLLSTDRVPADLTAFRLGILNHYGLGRYLACLNLSDIAACGGTPDALLLNLGLPSDLPCADFQALCQGFGDLAAQFDCRVLGGDITHSSELSISATSIGRVRNDLVLTRRHAAPGDTIFLSQPLGLTPTAFASYLRSQPRKLGLTDEELVLLNGQFTSVVPMLPLASRLAASRNCSACMDNTDGIGQSMAEMAAESGVAFVLDAAAVQIPAVVGKVANALGEDALRLAFSAGADFSLVGTLRGRFTVEQAQDALGAPLQLVGYVESGSGVWLESAGVRKPLAFSGWNYFTRL